MSVHVEYRHNFFPNIFDLRLVEFLDVDSIMGNGMSRGGKHGKHWGEANEGT
jgi:hypothetical protein